MKSDGKTMSKLNRMVAIVLSALVVNLVCVHIHADGMQFAIQVPGGVTGKHGSGE